MATLTEIPIIKADVPEEFVVEVNGRNYIFIIRYNETGDFFSLEIQDEDQVQLYSGKLIYASNVIQATVPGLDIIDKLIPLDQVDLLDNDRVNDIRVGFSELGENVKLFQIVGNEFG